MTADSEIPDDEPSRTGTVTPAGRPGFLGGLVALPSLFLIGGVRLYQVFLGPFFGGRCRFHPSCSHYFIQAVKKYGAVSGAFRGVWRILRCHPWSEGGIDPP